MQLISYILLIALTIALASIVPYAFSGGGVVLSNDTCTITIGFYDAHFTAYQPETSGNEEFCEDLPNDGQTIFVLDYLHGSLKEVPVDFRIIRDTNALGRFVRWQDVQAIQDIDTLTVFYQSPVVETDASLSIEMSFAEDGDYIGIVTAGHPSNDKTYNAVFPFRVGQTPLSFLYWLPVLVVLFMGALFYSGLTEKVFVSGRQP